MSLNFEIIGMYNSSFICFFFWCNWKKLSMCTWNVRKNKNLKNNTFLIRKDMHLLEFKDEKQSILHSRNNSKIRSNNCRNKEKIDTPNTKNTCTLKVVGLTSFMGLNMNKTQNTSIWNSWKDKKLGNNSFIWVLFRILQLFGTT